MHDFIPFHHMTFEKWVGFAIVWGMVVLWVRENRRTWWGKWFGRWDRRDR